jgi:hypothetical protein
MKRTIEVKGENDRDVYYRGKLIDYMAFSVQVHFGLRSKHKYAITVTESEDGQYRICYACRKEYYELWKDKDYLGRLCVKHMTKLFPIVEVGKKYNVTVKEVR